MRGLKTLISTIALLAGLAVVPAVHAQISINIGVQPVCSYGYYGYAPYACAPMGYYGSGYFYNGIFVGMGPWARWGYGHGWGSHRFNGDGGGRFHGGVGRDAYSGRQGGKQASRGSRSERENRGNPHSSGGRPGQSHKASHGGGQPHGGESRGSGGQAHGGGGQHAGGDHK